LQCFYLIDMPLLDVFEYRNLLIEHFQHFYSQFVVPINQISTLTFTAIILAICIPPIVALVFFEIEAAKARSKQPKGCRKLGLKIESNLMNEFDKKFSEGRPPSTEQTSAGYTRSRAVEVLS